MEQRGDDASLSSVVHNTLLELYLTAEEEERFQAAHGAGAASVGPGGAAISRAKNTERMEKALKLLQNQVRVPGGGLMLAFGRKSMTRAPPPHPSLHCSHTHPPFPVMSGRTWLGIWRKRSFCASCTTSVRGCSTSMRSSCSLTRLCKVRPRGLCTPPRFVIVVVVVVVVAWWAPRIDCGGWRRRFADEVCWGLVGLTLVGLQLGVNGPPPLPRSLPLVAVYMEENDYENILQSCRDYGAQVGPRICWLFF